MDSKLSFKGEVRPKIIRGSGHKGWHRIVLLIRDWMRLGR